MREPLASSSLGSGPFDEALACLRELAHQCPSERHLTHFRGRWDELEATTRLLRAAVERQPVAEP